MQNTYENRFLIYGDILGFKERVKDPQNIVLIEESLQQVTQVRLLGNFAHSFLKETEEENIEYCLFSDNFIFSCPKTEIASTLLSTVSLFLCELLQKGILCRGAIHVGKLHHVKNIVFGPTVETVYNIEQELCDPKFICTPEAIAEMKKLCIHDNLLDKHSLTIDHDNSTYLNYLYPCFMWKSSGINGVKNHIEQNRKTYKNDSSILKKWTYVAKEFNKTIPYWQTIQSIGSIDPINTEDAC